MARRKASDDDTTPPTHRAKLFWNGRSQAVRLPKEFRFTGDEVEIRRDGDAVILEPAKGRSWPEGYWEWLDENRKDLELGPVAPLGASMPDLTLDDE